MKEKFKQLPEILQKQIIFRIAAGAVSLLAFFIVLALYRNLFLCLSFVFFAIVFFCSGIFLLFRVVNGKYITIEGRCTRIDKSFLRKRNKSIYIESVPHKIKLNLRQKLKNISQGDDVVVYVLESTSVYQEEGYEILSGYLAIERKMRSGDGYD